MSKSHKPLLLGQKDNKVVVCCFLIFLAVVASAYSFNLLVLEKYNSIEVSFTKKLTV